MLIVTTRLGKVREMNDEPDAPRQELRSSGRRIMRLCDHLVGEIDERRHVQR